MKKKSNLCIKEDPYRMDLSKKDLLSALPMASVCPQTKARYARGNPAWEVCHRGQILGAEFCLPAQ